MRMWMLRDCGSVYWCEGHVCPVLSLIVCFSWGLVFGKVAGVPERKCIPMTTLEVGQWRYELQNHVLGFVDMLSQCLHGRDERKFVLDNLHRRNNTTHSIWDAKEGKRATQQDQSLKSERNLTHCVQFAEICYGTSEQQMNLKVTRWRETMGSV